MFSHLSLSCHVRRKRTSLLSAIRLKTVEFCFPNAEALALELDSSWKVPIKHTKVYYGDFWIVANKDKVHFALHLFITWKLQFNFSNCNKHATYFVVTSVEIKLAGQIAHCPLFKHCDYMSGNRTRFSRCSFSSRKKFFGLIIIC